MGTKINKTAKSTQILKSTKTGGKAPSKTKQLELEVAKLRNRLAELEASLKQILANPPAQTPVYVPMPYPVPQPQIVPPFYQPWWTKPYIPFPIYPTMPFIPYAPYIQPTYPSYPNPIWMVERHPDLGPIYVEPYQVPYTEYPDFYCGTTVVGSTTMEYTHNPGLGTQLLPGSSLTMQAGDSQLPFRTQNNTTGCASGVFETSFNSTLS